METEKMVVVTRRSERIRLAAEYAGLFMGFMLLRRCIQQDSLLRDFKVVSVMLAKRVIDDNPDLAEKSPEFVATVTKYFSQITPKMIAKIEKRVA